MITLSFATEKSPNWGSTARRQASLTHSTAYRLVFSHPYTLYITEQTWHSKRIQWSFAVVYNPCENFTSNFAAVQPVFSSMTVPTSLPVICLCFTSAATCRKLLCSYRNHQVVPGLGWVGTAVLIMLLIVTHVIATIIKPLRYHESAISVLLKLIIGAPQWLQVHLTPFL